MDTKDLVIGGIAGAAAVGTAVNGIKTKKLQKTQQAFSKASIANAKCCGVLAAGMGVTSLLGLANTVDLMTQKRFMSKAVADINSNLNLMKDDTADVSSRLETLRNQHAEAIRALDVIKTDLKVTEDDLEKLKSSHIAASNQLAGDVKNLYGSLQNQDAAIRIINGHVGNPLNVNVGGQQQYVPPVSAPTAGTETK